MAISLRRIELIEDDNVNREVSWGLASRKHLARESIRSERGKIITSEAGQKDLEDLNITKPLRFGTEGRRQYQDACDWPWRK